MNAAMWTAKTGVQAQDAKLQAIANNLANVNTTGFKRDRVVFEDLFYQVERQPGAAQAEGMNTPVGVQLGNGTRLVLIHRPIPQEMQAQTMMGWHTMLGLIEAGCRGEFPRRADLFPANAALYGVDINNLKKV